MKIKAVLQTMILFFLILMPLHASAQDGVPVLQSISFKNAVINGAYSSDVFEYRITLTDNTVTPTLESYSLQGDGNIFITYSYDETNHQTGIITTVEYASGSMIYHFDYANPAVYEINSNCNLSDITCTLGFVSPEISDGETEYKLYIPSDLTEIKMTPVTSDINAYCAPIDMVLGESQEPELTMTVIASDGTTQNYSFKIKRVDKTVAQVKEEMESPDYESFVEGTKFYEKTEFIVIVCACAGGALVMYLLYLATRKAMITPYDREETEFYLS